MMKYDAIIVASGKGDRAGLGFNKVFYRMKDGMTVLDHSLVLFIKDCFRMRKSSSSKAENAVRIRSGTAWMRQRVRMFSFMTERGLSCRKTISKH